MNNVYMAMSIAGSDSSGGAGIQADLKTMSALGVFACSVVTAVTCQNTLGVSDVLPIEERYVRGQINAVLGDLPVKAVKIGMLHDEVIARCVADCLHDNGFKGNVVLDPVMVATSGSLLAKENLRDALIKYLFPVASLVTPNLHEAEVLSGMEKIETEADMREAARRIVDSGAEAVLVKGGHLANDKVLKDILLRKKGGRLVFEDFVSEKINSENTHGTGCSLSSAIASYCAMGCDLSTAVGKAVEFVHNAILNAKDLFLGHGHGSLNHFFKPEKLVIYEDNRE